MKSFCIGCKFLHNPSILCKNQDCQNRLCPFSHQKGNYHEDDEDNTEVLDQEQEETFSANANQCHLCQNQSKDDVYYHVQMNHVEYFNEMMEIMNVGVS